MHSPPNHPLAVPGSPTTSSNEEVAASIRTDPMASNLSLQFAYGEGDRVSSSFQAPHPQGAGLPVAKSPSGGDNRQPFPSSHGQARVDGRSPQMLLAPPPPSGPGAVRRATSYQDFPKVKSKRGRFMSTVKKAASYLGVAVAPKPVSGPPANQVHVFEVPRPDNSGDSLMSHINGLRTPESNPSLSKSAPASRSSTPPLAIVGSASQFFSVNALQPEPSKRVPPKRIPPPTFLESAPPSPSSPLPSGDFGPHYGPARNKPLGDVGVETGNPALMRFPGPFPTTQSTPSPPLLFSNPGNGASTKTDLPLTTSSRPSAASSEVLNEPQYRKFTKNLSGVVEAGIRAGRIQRTSIDGPAFPVGDSLAMAPPSNPVSSPPPSTSLSNLSSKNAKAGTTVAHDDENHKKWRISLEAFDNDLISPSTEFYPLYPSALLPAPTFPGWSHQGETVPPTLPTATATPTSADMSSATPIPPQLMRTGSGSPEEVSSTSASSVTSGDSHLRYYFRPTSRSSGFGAEGTGTTGSNSSEGGTGTVERGVRGAGSDGYGGDGGAGTDVPSEGVEMVPEHHTDIDRRPSQSVPSASSHVRLGSEEERARRAEIRAGKLRERRDEEGEETGEVAGEDAAWADPGSGIPDLDECTIHDWDSAPIMVIPGRGAFIRAPKAGIYPLNWIESYVAVEKKEGYSVVSTTDGKTPQPSEAMQWLVRAHLNMLAAQLAVARERASRGLCPHPSIDTFRYQRTGFEPYYDAALDRPSPSSLAVSQPRNFAPDAQFHYDNLPSSRLAISRLRSSWRARGPTTLRLFDLMTLRLTASRLHDFTTSHAQPQSSSNHLVREPLLHNRITIV
ncbi:hypothetical protein NMY22_g6453 [Coprinellus aureogranulatus]|nr:hypothetical protein NMY22_g6453 [Coprinellus aureogranulatus]